MTSWFSRHASRNPRAASRRQAARVIPIREKSSSSTRSGRRHRRTRPARATTPRQQRRRLTETQPSRGPSPKLVHCGRTAAAPRKLADNVAAATSVLVRVRRSDKAVRSLIERALRSRVDELLEHGCRQSPTKLRGRACDGTLDHDLLGHPASPAATWGAHHRNLARKRPPPGRVQNATEPQEDHRRSGRAFPGAFAARRVSAILRATSVGAPAEDEPEPAQIRNI